jgi:hypothetical protein
MNNLMVRMEEGVKNGSLSSCGLPVIEGDNDRGWPSESSPADKDVGSIPTPHHKLREGSPQGYASEHLRVTMRKQSFPHKPLRRRYEQG